MLADFLQKSVLVDSIERQILPALQSLDPSQVRRAADAPAVTREQLNEAYIRLKEALEAEGVRSSLYPTLDKSLPPGWAALEEAAFFSSRPEIGLMQTVLQMRFGDKGRTDESGPAGHRGPGGTAAVTNQRLFGNGADGRRVFGAFEQTDVDWISCKFAEAITWLLRDKVRFPNDPAPDFAVAKDARLIVVGDWGSGLPRAQKVAKLMSACLAEALMENRQVHVIHLGDVYYSGFPCEAESNFLKFWPAKRTANVYSWCLNGNHDMFCGGRGYFNVILADPRFKEQRGLSRFALVHPQWEILGLDSAYEDHALANGQGEWAEKRLREAKSQGRKGLLLSHHQLFSAYESDGPKMREALRGPLEERLITSWFWGHEHRLCAYEDYQGVKNARCIGHGGVPVYQFHGTDAKFPGPPKAPLAWEFRDWFSTGGGLERWALFGFATVDFERDGLKVNYFHENASEDPVRQPPKPHHTEILT